MGIDEYIYNMIQALARLSDLRIAHNNGSLDDESYLEKVKEELLDRLDITQVNLD